MTDPTGAEIMAEIDRACARVGRDLRFYMTDLHRQGLVDCHTTLHQLRIRLRSQEFVNDVAVSRAKTSA